MAAYIALLRKDASSDYGVDFPDLPGCVTAGRTLEEARRAAAEALALHLEGMAEDGEAVPVPAELDAVMTDPHNADAVGFLVDAPVTAPRSVRINVMLPEDVLKAIDRVSGNRSRFLADAARTKLQGGMKGTAEKRHVPRRTCRRISTATNSRPCSPALGSP